MHLWRGNITTEITQEGTCCGLNKILTSGGMILLYVASVYVLEPRFKRLELGILLGSEVIGGEYWGELPAVGLYAEVPSFSYVFRNTITVLEAMAELPQGIHMAEKRWLGTKRYLNFENLVFLSASIVIELNDGEGVYSCGVWRNGVLSHQWGSYASVFKMVDVGIY